jgi:hypothetical protein
VGPRRAKQSNRENAANDGHGFALDGAKDAKGIGTHADSRIVIDLGGQSNRFEADLGVDDEVGNAGSVGFVCSPMASRSSRAACCAAPVPSRTSVSTSVIAAEVGAADAGGRAGATLVLDLQPVGQRRVADVALDRVTGALELHARIYLLFADAHFNLVTAPETLGGRRQAVDHLERYVALTARKTGGSPDPFVTEARERIARLASGSVG